MIVLPAAPFIRWLGLEDTYAIFQTFSFVCGMLSLWFLIYNVFFVNNEECITFHDEIHKKYGESYSLKLAVKEHINKFKRVELLSLICFLPIYVFLAHERATLLVPLLDEFISSHTVSVALSAALFFTGFPAIYYSCLYAALSAWGKRGFVRFNSGSIKTVRFAMFFSNALYFVYAVLLAIYDVYGIFHENEGWSFMLTSLLCLTACMVLYLADAIYTFRSGHRTIGRIKLIAVIFGSFLLCGNIYYSMVQTLVCHVYLVAFAVLEVIFAFITPKE
jgi:hypothetical protein